MSRPVLPKDCDSNAEPFPAGAPEPSDGAVIRDLDPADWSDFRKHAHAMLDDMITHIETIRERPVWRPAPASTRERFRQPLPREGRDLGDAHLENGPVASPDQGEHRDGDERRRGDPRRGRRVAAGG